ncbi:MAG TPA: class I SAM-dependent methyltransferase, partial [Ktedonobacteraceae bacterium]|nr:class I SAM-dependent methyltransferase [Ktedonobacteraceae bacterium]
LARECMRILRPGGIIRFTEVEAGFSNMPAFERIFGVLFRALHLAGQSFSPNGQHIGLIPMLKRIMRDAGYQDIQHLAHMVDFSAGTPGNRGFHDDLDVGFKLAQPFLTKTKAITPEEFDVLYPQAMDEMLSEEFCGVWMLLTAWGRKP